MPDMTASTAAAVSCLDLSGLPLEDRSAEGIGTPMGRTGAMPMATDLLVMCNGLPLDTLDGADDSRVAVGW